MVDGNENGGGDRNPAGGDTTVSGGQSVSASDSVGSPSRSEQVAATPVSESTFVRRNHLDIHADDADAQGKKKKRVQRVVGGDKNGRGLRQFSMKVCEKVESKGRTTYNEVADELVAEFADPAISGAPDQAERTALQNKIEKKAAYLQELEEQYAGHQILIQRNEQLFRSENAPSQGVQLPFILVQTRPHATVEVEISEDMQLVHFDFNSTPFKLHDDNFVLKAMNFCQRSLIDDSEAANYYIPLEAGEESLTKCYKQEMPLQPCRSSTSGNNQISS